MEVLHFLFSVCNTCRVLKKEHATYTYTFLLSSQDCRAFLLCIPRFYPMQMLHIVEYQVFSYYLLVPGEVASLYHVLCYSLFWDVFARSSCKICR